MKIIGATEARANFSDLLRRVSVEGERIVIERRGKPRALLVPLEENGDVERQSDTAALRRTYALFNETERLAKLGHWEWDEVEDRCIYCSGELARLHGVTREEFLRRASSLDADLDWVHPEDRAAYRATVEEMKRLGKGHDLEYRLLQPDGGWIDVREVSQVVLDDKGAVVRSFGFVQDITERKKSERTLRESEALLTQAAEMARLGHWVWDEIEDRCTYCSETLARMNGVTVEEYLAKYGTMEALLVDLHPEDRGRYERTIAEAKRDRREYDVEYRDVWPSAEIRYLREIGEPVLDATGRHVRTVGTLQDITEHREAEAALRASETALAKAQRLARMGNWRWSIDRDELISGSEQFARIYGVTPAEIHDHLASQIERVVHPEDRDRVAEAFRRFDETGCDYEIEYRIVRPDGEARHVLEIGEAVRDDAGRPVEQVGTLQDITEFKRIEEELRRARDELEIRVAERTAELEEKTAQLQSILDHSPTMVFLKDAEGRYLLANREFERTFAVTNEALAGKLPKDILDPELAESSREQDLEIIRRGEPSTREEGFVIDGSRRTLLTSKFPVRDEGRNLIGIGAVATDITERKQAEDALRTREAQLRQAQKMARVGVFVWDDVEDRCLYCSEELAALLGITVEEFMERRGSHQSILRWIHEEDRSRYDRVIARALEQAAPYDVEYRVHDNAGGLCHWRELGEPELDAQGRQIRTFGTVQDITQQKLTEEQLRQAQKMEAVGQLTGGVAHDFNNLLAVISGNAELLSLELGDDDPKVQAMLRATNRGAALTQQLLAFSRRQTLQPRALDLNALVRDMLEMLSRSLGETIEIKASLAGGLWRALADPGQVENALLNLAINARDAMPVGGTLVIETANARLDEAYAERHPEVAPGDYVMLTLTDSGTGMASDVREHAFEPFFTTKGVGQGTGLGLSMVYGFAKQSGGHATIYSEQGVGTTVKLYLPRTRAKADDLQDSETATPLGRNETILLVEDDKDVRQLATALLEGLNYIVHTAEDGRRALEMLEHVPRPDLMLSDVVLPGGLSGPDLAQRVLEVYPDIKIVFMSGYPADAVTNNRLLHPGKVLLNKPFSRQKLAEALREALD